MEKLGIIDYGKLLLRIYAFHDLDAMHSLGAWYGSGNIRGVSKTKSNLRAAYYYKKSADQGHAESQYDLGFMMIENEVPDAKYEEGVELLKKSASAGYQPAAELLAALL